MWLWRGGVLHEAERHHYLRDLWHADAARDHAGAEVLMTATTARVRVLLRDTQTGDEAWEESDVEVQYLDGQQFWWTEGNACCDCNRLTFLHRALGKEQDVTDDRDPYPCGDGRVVIVRAEVDGVEQPSWVG